MTAADRIYSALMKRDREAEKDLSADVRRDLPANGVRLIAANGLQSTGDETVSASTVLPWLFTALGVPAFLTGLLVPIRESGSMLPQALLTPLILRIRRRTHVLAAGSLIQALAAAVMAGTAALGSGLAAGVVIVVALAVFSLGRCLNSIASKDVQGRVVPKGERGQINGLATTAAGIVAVTLGLGLRVLGDGLGAGTIALIIAAGAALWVAVALAWLSVREPADDPDEDPASQPGSAPAAEARSGERTGSPEPASASEEGSSSPGSEHSTWFGDVVRLLRDDADFRLFVTVRSLLLVSALSPPFIVAMSAQSGADALTGLGGFVIASGLASLLGGRIFGRLADRSSRRLMTVGAATASAIIVALVVIVSLPGYDPRSAAAGILCTAAYFLLTLAHTGVRVARKTYVVDLASGDLRTTYVAVSNTTMGIVLLAVGAVSSGLAAWGVEAALLLLAAMGLAGVVASLRLPEVSRG